MDWNSGMDLVSCPDPLAHAKRVWCSEQHFFSHGVGPYLGFEITNQIAEDQIISYFEANQK